MNQSEAQAIIDTQPNPSLRMSTSEMCAVLEKNADQLLDAGFRFYESESDCGWWVPGQQPPGWTCEGDSHGNGTTEPCRHPHKKETP